MVTVVSTGRAARRAGPRRGAPRPPPCPRRRRSGRSSRRGHRRDQGRARWLAKGHATSPILVGSTCSSPIWRVHPPQGAGLEMAQLLMAVSIAALMTRRRARCPPKRTCSVDTAARGHNSSSGKSGCRTRFLAKDPRAFGPPTSGCPPLDAPHDGDGSGGTPRDRSSTRACEGRPDWRRRRPAGPRSGRSTGWLERE